MTSIGRFRKSNNYVANETRWQSEKGEHLVSLYAARFEDQKVEELKPFPNCNILFAACWPEREPEHRNVVVGKYRYYHDLIDTSFELEAGKFWQQDTGAKLRIKRMFGDVSVHLTYKNTKRSGQEENQHIGIGFSIPLTPKKDHYNKYFQLRGKPQWNYTVSTLVGKSHNNLTPGTGDAARTFYNLDDNYFNGDRLSASYLYRNAERLKQVDLD